DPRDSVVGYHAVGNLQGRVVSGNPAAVAVQRMVVRKVRERDRRVAEVTYVCAAAANACCVAADRAVGYLRTRSAQEEKTAAVGRGIGLDRGVGQRDAR